MYELIVPIVSSFATIGATVLTVWKGNNLIAYRVQKLEEKQDKHNTLIERMYRLEDRANLIEEKQKVANHRIDDLEKGKTV